VTPQIRSNRQELEFDSPRRIDSNRFPAGSTLKIVSGHLVLFYIRTNIRNHSPTMTAPYATVNKYCSLFRDAGYMRICDRICDRIFWQKVQIAYFSAYNDIFKIAYAENTPHMLKFAYIAQISAYAIALSAFCPTFGHVV